MRVLFQTILDGRFAIRVCITNHRSALADFDILTDAVVSIGQAIAQMAASDVS